MQETLRKVVRCILLGKCGLRRKSRIGILALLICCYSVVTTLFYSRSVQVLVGDPAAALAPFFSSHFGNQANTNDYEFSACLLVMDDNHFLIEWLAYHYHALNLRTLILSVDPNSQTSPALILERWKQVNDMTIIEWQDTDFMTKEEFDVTRTDVMNYFHKSQITPKLVSHRARQRLFYYKCLRELKEQNKKYVLLTDTDEFVTINYQTSKAQNSIQQPPSLEEPGAVARYLHNQLHGPEVDDSNQNEPLYYLQSSPCIQIPRLRFGAEESHSKEVGGGFNTSQFLTMRYAKHAHPTDYQKNKISKAIIDLTRVPEQEIVPVDSIHLPIRSICHQHRLHLKTSQSLLQINHYLGSFEQYTYRENDARLGKERSQEQWELQTKLKNAQVDHSIQPWLSGFFKFHPHVAPEVLQGVGELESKSWRTFQGNPNLDRCALCFFGLPRAYRSMVLPSVVRNVLMPNARHSCDVYVHFYSQKQEAAGRKNRGGKINPDEIFLLERAAKAVQKLYGPKYGRNANREPMVRFVYDTEEQFLEKRGASLQRYHNTVTKDGKPVYYPWAAKTYTNQSLDNIVKQWHSIEYAFKLMEVTAQEMNVNYSRVAMFRSDAMYLTPVDIAMLDKGEIDTKNQHAVVAPFARMPINDRMIYGPYSAVKVWSSKRFEYIEDRVNLAEDPGYEMHSERFLNASIFPAMENLGYRTTINRDICFVRTRADEAAMVSDCQVGGTTRGWQGVDKQAIVEDIVQRNCTKYYMGIKSRWTFVGCGKGIEYFDGN